MRIRRAQHGDTLVEVLFAMAIVALTLGSAFAIMNRGLAQGRDALERTEALQIAENQLELLRYSVANSGTVPTASGNLCYFVDDTNAIDSVNNSGVAIAMIAAVGDLDAFEDACKQGFGGRYHVGVQRVDGSAGFHYEVFVYWERFGGDGVERVELVYRLAEATP